MSKLDALAWDRLKESSWSYGGVGANRFHDAEGIVAINAPVCIFGHAKTVEYEEARYGIQNALWRAGVDFDKNDAAVRRINRRRWFGLGRLMPWTWNNRVPFDALMQELRVERGQ